MHNNKAFRKDPNVGLPTTYEFDENNDCEL